MEVLISHRYSAFGPREPAGFAKLRRQYHKRRQQQDRVEARIGLTDGGLEWLMRVRRIGYRQP